VPNEAEETRPGCSNSYEILQRILHLCRYDDLINSLVKELDTRRQNYQSHLPLRLFKSSRRMSSCTTIHCTFLSLLYLLCHSTCSKECHSVKSRNTPGHPCSYQPSTHSPVKSVPCCPSDQCQQIQSSLSTSVSRYHREHWKDVAISGANLNPCQTELNKTSLKLRQDKHM